MKVRASVKKICEVQGDQAQGRRARHLREPAAQAEAGLRRNMARIAGVDLPRNKRMEIALTYIYGIGRHAANVVLEQAGVSPDKRTDDLDENGRRKIRDAIEANYQGRRRSAPRRLAEHQAPDGPRLLPRPASPQGPAGARPAHAHQCAHAQGPAAWRCKKLGAVTKKERRQPKRSMSTVKAQAEEEGQEEHPDRHRPHPATFNNTIVTITDVSGNVVAWSSAGVRASRARASRRRSPRSSPPRTPRRRRWSTACATSPST